MFVTTSNTGASFKNEPSDSSASATRKSPSPNLALEPPRQSTLPPITIVGSRPASANSQPTIEVVVVLPWLPAMAMPNLLSRISSASISALGMTGICASTAARISGLFGGIAEEITTTSASFTHAPSWPMWTVPPSLVNRRVISVFCISDPLIR